MAYHRALTWRSLLAGGLIAASAAATALAQQDQYRDPKGQLSIPASPDWTFHIGADGSAEIECKFGPCRDAPPSIRKSFCSLALEHGPQELFTGARLQKLAADSAAGIIKGLNARAGTYTIAAAPVAKTLANGSWMVTRFSGTSRRSKSPIDGAIWMAGRGGTGVLIYCLLPHDLWPEMDSKLERMVASVAWSSGAPAATPPAAAKRAVAYSFASIADWDIRRAGTDAALICKFEPCSKTPPSLEGHFCMLSEDDVPGGRGSDPDVMRRLSLAAARGITEALIQRGNQVVIAHNPSPITFNGNVWHFTPISGRLKTGMDVEGGIWTAGNGAMALTIQCLHARKDWPTVARRLRSLVESLIWASSAR